MRAALIDRYGPPDVFRVGEAPDPSPGPDDLLIQVHAASVNPVDTKIRRGLQRGDMRPRMPAILGLDVSGVVLAIGDRVEGFAVGDEVFASPTHRRPGTYAERVCIDAGAVAHKPRTVSHAEAAGLPLVALTAWEALVTRANLQAGETVLIQAGAGGVGTVAIQLAKHLGARVITTCSPRNDALVRELGADEVINYRETPFESVCGELDVVLDSLGDAAKRAAVGTLRRGGRLVTLNSDLPPLAARYGPYLAVLASLWRMLAITAGARLSRGVRVWHVLRPCHGPTLARIAALVDEGAIRPVVDRVLPLEQVAEAHAYNETGRARGKIIIQVAPT